MVTTIAATGTMSERAYRELALGEAGRFVELWDGEPREKPAMSVGHGWTLSKLGFGLMQQLDWGEYQVRINHGRVRRTARNCLIPDVMVIPTALVAERGDPSSLDAYDRPLPLVAEVWSPATGEYEVTAKLAGYQRRGDEEIWYLHPFEQTLTAWRGQPDGRSTETTHREGVDRPASLPGVAIDLAALFAG